MQRLIAAGLLVLVAACSSKGTRAVAERIESRSQLIGGPASLGDVGDLKLSNGKVRFVVQGITQESPYSRGWGVYGGALLDADLVRPDTSPTAPNGEDRFGEFFPAYFLEAIEPESVEIGNDGANGEPATVIVRGRASPFISLAKTLLDVAMQPEGLELVTTYSLGANDQWLTVTAEFVNDRTGRKIDVASLGSLQVGIPLGFVLLFGNQNEVFLPGAGFDMRHALEDSYKAPARLPALPGLTTDILATRGEHVSYGLAVKAPENPEHSYVWRNRDVIPGAKPDQMLVPFFASSFTGAFLGQPPSVPMNEGDRFAYSAYFFVGDGDVGSIRDLQYQAQNTKDVGRITALVREAETNAVVPDASLVVLGADGKPFSQYDPDADGRVTGRLPAGKYKAIVVADNRDLTSEIEFEVRSGFTTEIDNTAAVRSTAARTLEVPRTSRLVVKITDKDGLPLPGRVTLLAEAPSSVRTAGVEPRKFLYDLALGQRMLASDGIPDEADGVDGSGRPVGKGATRRYVERILLAGVDGVAAGDVRPGSYAVLVSRGPEYDVHRVGELVVLEPGKQVERTASLTRVIDTPGWISADFHVHTAQSIDGHIALDERVLSYAAEGVEWVVATDHNFVTDLQPEVQRLALSEWLNTSVGLEMTTLEMGHFNAFPVRYDPAAITHGAFDWVNLPPRDLFRTLRALAPTTTPDNVVQVNHPRDTILGYYNQFNVSPDTGFARNFTGIAYPNGEAFGRENFSLQFDAMEVFNGKRNELLRTYRMPVVMPPPPVPAVPSQPGEIVRKPCPPENTACVYAQQDPAFPGAIDDWFRLLNNGGTGTEEEPIRPVTGTGNSDSHGLYFEEAGYPRNWVFVGKDDLRKVTETDIARAVHRHEVMFSNGPFIDVLADGGGLRTSPIGGLLVPENDLVRLNIRVLTPPWLSVDRLLIFVNGEEVKRIPLERRPDRVLQCCEQPIELRLTKDSWIVVAAEGDSSMFPFLSPLETPPLAISDAVGAIAGPLGLGDDGMGNLRPPVVHPATPFAMTNPIWVDRSGPNGVGPPDGASFGRGRDITVGDGQSPLVGRHDRVERRSVEVMPNVPESKKIPRTSDLSKIFRAWGHGHAH